MTRAARARLSRVTAAVAALAGVWSLYILVFGGFDARVGSLNVSSNNPVNPMILAVVSGLAAWRLGSADDRRRVRAGVAASRLLSPGMAPVIAATAAAIVVGVGIFKGARGIGGADAYGYVSQAELWIAGRLSYEEPLVAEFEGKLPPNAFAPLGYHPTGNGRRMAPAYAPGLPLAMAPFRWAAGREAVFLVVPLLAGLAVWCTYLMGARLAHGAVGAGAAVLLSTSPVFLLHTLTAPMSDVPAAAWWAVVLALAIRGRPGAALGAGAAASAAILTRPNLAPLAAIVAAPWLVQGVRRPDLRRDAWRCVAAFGIGLAPGVAIVALLNAHLYGSPLMSGQVISNPPLSLANVPINFPRYVSWMFDTQTVAVLAALLAPVLLARAAPSVPMAGSRAGTAATWLAVVLAVFGTYLVFMPVDDWFWLRYLLPAFPPLFVLMCGSVSALLARHGREARLVGVALLVAYVSARAMAFNRGIHLERTEEAEEKYRLVGEYVRTRSPERSIFISTLYSGTIRYYSGRPTVLYLFIADDGLDRAVADFVARGYRPYLVLDRSELDYWNAHFLGRSRLAALDWTPEVAFDHSSGVRIFDLTKR